MLISVIIPAYNEEKDIAECLESLKKQSFKKFEIIVVDDGSNDNTLGIIRGFRGIRVLKGEHQGPGFSRNLGAKVARGGILIFVDADMTFDRNYLKNLIDPIIKGKAYGTAHGVEYASNLQNIWSRCGGKTRVDPKTKEHAIFRAIRKDIFFEKGGFDPRYGYADDQTFFLKYGMKALAVNNAACYHKNPETLKAVYMQSKWIGASIDNQFTRTPIIRHLLPFFMILASPISIPVFSVKHCYSNKDFTIFPQMLVFMVARYLGTINGLLNKVYLNKNIR